MIEDWPNFVKATLVFIPLLYYNLIVKIIEQSYFIIYLENMGKITISAIKADVGSLGGHVTPSKELVMAVGDHIQAKRDSAGLIDFKLSTTGDDVCILMTHQRGENNSEIHKLAFDAFMKGGEMAESQGLYGAKQDLLITAFTGNVKGMGPAACEMEIEERPGETVILFAADKTDPGAYNGPLYHLSDPMYNSGLLLNPSMKGFKYTVMDVSNTEGDRIIELQTPADLYDLAALLRDLEKFVVEKIQTLDGEIMAVVSTSRLHNIAGTYTGKDDPICLIRAQKNFPATGEILAPYVKAEYVAGFMRGSHVGPLVPSKLGAKISYFDGPPKVTAAGYNLKDGFLAGPVDLFEDPFWGYIRAKAHRKAVEMREQGFRGPAMLPMAELEYGGMKQRLADLDSRFKFRN